MKNIFKVIAFSFTMLIGMSSVNAQSLKQNQNRPEVIAKKQTQELSEKLNLTGDQQRYVFRALVSKESNYKKYVTGKNANDASVIANKKKYDEVFDINMKKTLTPEQYKKWTVLNSRKKRK